MIDTIYFKVYDLAYHADICQLLDKSLAQKGTSVIMKEPLTDQQHVDYRHKAQWRKFVSYWDNAREGEVRYFHHLKSNHYDIAYCIDGY